MFSRAFSLSVLRKRTGARVVVVSSIRSPAALARSGQLRAPVRSAPEESGEIYR